MTEEERNKMLEEAGKATRFSSDRRPDPESVSRGVKEAFQYKKLREKFFKSLTGMKVVGGSEVDFWEATANKIKDAVFNEKSKVKLTDKEKLYFLKSLLKELPRDDKLTMDFGEKSNVHFYLPEKDKEPEIEQNIENNIDESIKNTETESSEEVSHVDAPSGDTERVL